MNNSYSVDLNTIVVQTDGLLSSELDGETVLMGVTQGAYFGMDATAQRIWNMVVEPRRVSDLCDQLASDYEVERKTCEQDVCTFLTELHKEGLVRIVAEDGG